MNDAPLFGNSTPRITRSYKVSDQRCFSDKLATMLSNTEDAFQLAGQVPGDYTFKEILYGAIEFSKSPWALDLDLVLDDKDRLETHLKRHGAQDEDQMLEAIFASAKEEIETSFDPLHTESARHFFYAGLNVGLGSVTPEAISARLQIAETLADIFANAFQNGGEPSPELKKRAAEALLSLMEAVNEHGSKPKDEGGAA